MFTCLQHCVSQQSDILLFISNLVSKYVTAILINFIVDFKTTLFANLCFCTYGNEVLQRRSACLVDRCGMLSVIAFRAECQVRTDDTAKTMPLWIRPTDLSDCSVARARGYTAFCLAPPGSVPDHQSPASLC